MKGPKRAGQFYWVKLHPEWGFKGWQIAVYGKHEFDGNTYDWAIFDWQEQQVFHAYSKTVIEIGQRIKP